MGIGASAGGLEALEQFLGAVPPGCGMGFVIVQHQDPTREGMLAELLQRATELEVVQVEDGMAVEPGRAHVIPPNKDLAIVGGVLQLLEPKARRGLRLPINFFLESLAADQQESSIGVILSGMGTDGTEGLKAIKEKAGLTFVQDPRSAGSAGMPRSAIDSGLADVIAPANELPGRIQASLHASRQPRQQAGDGEQVAPEIGKIVALLRARTGHDFALYKRSTICRRVERRMGLHQLGQPAAYVRFLQDNPHELDLLFKELLIGVTSFFRDPEAWEHLRDEVLPGMLRATGSRQMLRAWVSGCSSGEEAYSVAMAFSEAMEQAGAAGRVSMQIFGTDLDRDAIDKARAGAYPDSITANVSQERLARFFIHDEHGYRVGKGIREMVIFAPQNIIMDPPFTKLDLVVCRNLLIYLAPELQRRVLAMFHYALRPGGALFLGSAETAGAAGELFAPLGAKTRLYRRVGTAEGSRPEFPGSLAHPPEDKVGVSTAPAVGQNLQWMVDQLLLQRYSPAAVLVNPKGDILYISGRTGKFLEPAAGKANWNIYAMARDGLRHELGAAFRKALEGGGPVKLKGLQIRHDSGAQAADVTVEAVESPPRLRGMVMVVFREVPAVPAAPPPSKPRRGSSGHARLSILELELQQAREELRTAREEMQTSQEELKSANEELQSTNEELQSTNEELTTSKEEMQSLNEELQTVNQELQAKLDELQRTSSDMKNLLNSTELAVLFLDGALRVRRFTNQASKVIKLIPGDVGRPVTDIASDLIYPEFEREAQEVLRTLASIEKNVATHDGRWFTVRIMPYRTLEDRIDGLVMTFLEVTASKQLEARLREAQALLEQRSREQSGALAEAHRRLREGHGPSCEPDDSGCSPVVEPQG